VDVLSNHKLDGDAGILKRVRSEMRRFNIVGDTTFCKGKSYASTLKIKLRWSTLRLPQKTNGAK